MRRFVAVFVSTIAGLVVLLSFKTTSVKAPPSAALGSATPGTPSDPVSSAPASSAAVSSVAASSAPARSAPASSPVTSAPAATAATTTSAAAAKPTPTPKATPTKASPKPTVTPKPTATAAAKKTVTGTAITVGEGGREFGVVQVQLTIQNGKIISAVAIRYPENESRSSEISSYSIPILSREVLAAQGTSINAVSGATYTSDAYAQSAQAALDAAKA